MEAPLIAFAIIALLAGPVLAMIALIAVRRLQNDSNNAHLQDLTSRVYALERMVRNVEGRVTLAKPTVAEAEAEPAVTSLTTPPLSPAAASHPAVQPISAAESPNVTRVTSPAPPRFPSPDHSVQADLESVIGGRWLNRIGIVALLIAVSYFLKLAFDNNWIGPTGRVAIGILLGAVMLPWSHWLLGRGYTYFSEGIAALGEATLFLSVWAGRQFYALYSRDVGFAAMIFIIAVMAAIAIRRDSQRVAILSLLGGLMAPVLASSGKDQQVVLFSYLLLLGAGTLVIAAKKNWTALAPIAFAGAQIYFWGWYAEFFHRTSPLERTAVFASLFFLLYSALPARKTMRGLKLNEVEIFFILLNEFAYASALFVLLWPDEKWPLTLLCVALAAAHVGVARLMPSGNENTAMIRMLFAGLALTYLTLSIPVRLEGNWITLSFAVEGAILVWSGFRALSNFLRQGGYLLLALAALRMLVWPPDGGTFLWNARFSGFLALIVCLAIALWAARTHQKEIAGQERLEVGFFGVAINIFALIALSAEFWDYFGRISSNNRLNASIDAALEQHLSLSILWTAYASALVFIGVQKKTAPLRWQGLALFGLVVGKVFLYDLSFLDRAYRILSFFVLGAVLLAVSFLYQRKLARERLS